MIFDLRLPLKDEACNGYAGHYYGFAYRNHPIDGLGGIAFELGKRRPSKLPEDLIELADVAIARDTKYGRLHGICHTAAATALRLCTRPEHDQPQLEVVSNVIAVTPFTRSVQFEGTQGYADRGNGVRVASTAATEPHLRLRLNKTLLYLPHESYEASREAHYAVPSHRGGLEAETYVAQLGGEQIVVIDGTIAGAS